MEEHILKFNLLILSWVQFSVMMLGVRKPNCSNFSNPLTFSLRDDIQKTKKAEVRNVAKKLALYMWSKTW